jgi:hypothetical protein
MHSHITRFRRRRRPGVARARIISLGLLAVAAAIVSLWAPPSAATAPAAPARAQRDPIPVLAYYYIWFDPTSWDRAKTDLPLLGPYSSDDAGVMRQHIRWAKDAGIAGFVVSWKSTDILNRRLQRLVQIADEEDFKLAIIYQGLNFNRDPLPVDRIAADLTSFVTQYGDDPAFDLFGQPVVIWSGTWKFSHDDVAQVSAAVGTRLSLLASEKNLAGYQRLADLVAGDAYYWSSVNPDTFPNYPEKLQAMGAAIHANKGLWIAPAAVGFDARLIGGTQVIDRKDGTTLRQEMSAAVQSSPDAIGLISWNEFSENSHLEPSRNFGRHYLDVLADLHNAVPPAVKEINVDSSGTEGTDVQVGSLLLLGGLGAVVVLSLGIIVWRGLRRGPDDSTPKILH